MENKLKQNKKNNYSQLMRNMCKINKKQLMLWVLSIRARTDLKDKKNAI